MLHIYKWTVISNHVSHNICILLLQRDVRKKNRKNLAVKSLKSRAQTVRSVYRMEDDILQSMTDKTGGKCNTSRKLRIGYSENDKRKRNTRVGTLIVATIYLQLIQNRYMFRSFTVLQCSHQHCVQPVASDVEVVGYL